MPESMSSAVMTGAATMAVIGAIDGAADNGAFGLTGRAGWKVALGALGVGLNCMAFVKNNQDTALKVYLGSLVAVAGATIYLCKKN